MRNHDFTSRSMLKVMNIGAASLAGAKNLSARPSKREYRVIRD